MNKWETKSGYRIIRVLSGRSNVFLLTNDRINILIDTSVSRNWKKLQKRLLLQGVTTIDFLILSHAHFDHAANAFRIKEKFGAKVILHREEEKYLMKGGNILPKGTTFFTRLIVNVFGKNILPAFGYTPCKPDILTDGEYDLHAIGFNARLVHTPGHTMGSISVLVDDELAMVGDTMFGIFPGSVFPPYADNVNAMIRSWGELLETDCSVFLPSHGSARSKKRVQKGFDKRIKRIPSADTHNL